MFIKKKKGKSYIYINDRSFGQNESRWRTTSYSYDDIDKIDIKIHLSIQNKMYYFITVTNNCK